MNTAQPPIIQLHITSIKQQKFNLYTS